MILAMVRDTQAPGTERFPGALPFLERGATLGVRSETSA
jgi:hypothetical protein